MQTSNFVLTSRLLGAGVSLMHLAGPANATPVSVEDSAAAVRALQQWLPSPRSDRAPMADAAFAAVPMTKADATRARELLWEDHAALIRATRAEELKDREIEIDGRTMKFEWQTFGTRPPTGHSLFISLHGGGGAPRRVNDDQWANQIRLGKSYRPAEGIYVAPRAPTNTWNLWHEAHIDTFFDRLIQNFIVLEGINPDRVYLLGYSAGGDGVYQVAPRFADRLAAASMMAGHPNEASPLGLRNIGFALHVGANDAMFDRNKVAQEWARQLQTLRAQDPEGYAHQSKIHEGKGHWMDLEDRMAIPWMEKFSRTPWPRVVTWKQDDVIHSRFYWLAVDAAQAQTGDTITARMTDRTVHLTTNRPLTITLLLDDALLDLDQPLTVTAGDGAQLFHGQPQRTIATLHQTLTCRGQAPLAASAKITLPPTPPPAPKP